jgi:hypothetical protein
MIGYARSAYNQYCLTGSKSLVDLFKIHNDYLYQLA